MSSETQNPSDHEAELIKYFLDPQILPNLMAMSSLDERNMIFNIAMHTPCIQNHFIKACIFGNLDIVRKLLHFCTETTWIDGYIAAAGSGRIEIVAYLLDCKTFSVYVRNNQAFLQAAEHGHANMIEWFLNNFNINVDHPDGLPIVRAAQRDYLNVVQLLKNSVNRDAAIEIAAKNGHQAVVDFLQNLME